MPEAGTQVRATVDDAKVVQGLDALLNRICQLGGRDSAKVARAFRGVSGDDQSGLAKILSRYLEGGSL